MATARRQKDPYSHYMDMLYGDLNPVKSSGSSKKKQRSSDNDMTDLARDFMGATFTMGGIALLGGTAIGMVDALTPG